MEVQQTKICTKCKEKKSISSFYSRKSKSGTASECKECKLKYTLEYSRTEKGKEIRHKATRKWVCNNAQRVNATQNLSRKNKKLRAISLLGGVCVDCKLSFSECVYDFHHLNPKEKEFSPAHIFNLKWETILKEISKCVLLCANCHRLRHHLDKE